MRENSQIDQRTTAGTGEIYLEGACETSDISGHVRA